MNDPVIPVLRQRLIGECCERTVDDVNLAKLVE